MGWRHLAPPIRTLQRWWRHPLPCVSCTYWEVKLRASNVLSLPLVAAACPLLQVLVVHVCLETGQQVSLSLHSSMQRLSTATAALMLVCGSPGICLQSCVRRTYRWARERVLLPRLRSWCSTPMQRMFLS